MLPNFLIIGAQKAASSWLTRCLGLHPDVFMWRTEIHFFNAHYENGVSWYEKHFNAWSGEQMVGEKSPHYLNDPESPGRIRSVLGENVRLIANLRHPVDRAYSAYWHCLRNNDIPPHTDFPTALRLLPALRANSEYSEPIERYQVFFEKDQLLIQVFEEMNHDRVAALERCFEFLRVDPSLVGSAAASRVNASGELRLFSGIAHRISRRLNRLPSPVRQPMKRVGRTMFKALPIAREYQALSPDIRADLSEGFRPDIERLEELLGRDLDIWLQ